jgi:hypothetical protein
MANSLLLVEFQEPHDVDALQGGKVIANKQVGNHTVPEERGWPNPVWSKTSKPRIVRP